MSKKEYYFEIIGSGSFKAEASAPIMDKLRRAIRQEGFEETNFEIKVERVSKRGADVELSSPEERPTKGGKHERRVCSHKNIKHKAAAPKIRRAVRKRTRKAVQKIRQSR